MIIRFLGTHNAESANTRLMSLVIDERLAVDAGSLASELTFTEQEQINAILVSHGHYDHVRSVPAFAFNNSARVTRLFASQEALDVIASHLSDGVIYPDFTTDKSFLGRATLRLTPVRPHEPLEIEGFQVTAVPVNHAVGAVGFQIISREGTEVFYTGDTGPGLLHAWKTISPRVLIIDLTMPDRLEDIAKQSGHLCPATLKQELVDFRAMKGYLPRIVLVHLSPKYETEIAGEVDAVSRELRTGIGIAREGERISC